MRKSFLASLALLLIGGCALHVHYHRGEQHFEVPKDHVIVKTESPDAAKSDIDKVIDSLNERAR